MTLEPENMQDRRVTNRYAYDETDVTNRYAPEKLENVDLLQLWKDLNRPNLQKFARELKKRGIPARINDIEAALRPSQGASQIFAPPPKYQGNIVSRDLDYKWVADTIVHSSNPSSYRGVKWTHVLVVQDVFSRYAWAELMTSAMHSADAFQKILEKSKRTPKRLLTDADPGFKTREFKALCAENDIDHQFRFGRNDIATMDRLISIIRRAFARNIAETGDNDWAEQLQKVIKGHNESSNPHLIWAALLLTCLATTCFNLS